MKSIASKKMQVNYDDIRVYEIRQFDEKEILIFNEHFSPHKVVQNQSEGLNVISRNDAGMRAIVQRLTYTESVELLNELQKPRKESVVALEV